MNRLELMARMGDQLTREAQERDAAVAAVYEWPDEPFGVGTPPDRVIGATLYWHVGGLCLATMRAWDGHWRGTLYTGDFNALRTVYGDRLRILSAIADHIANPNQTPVDHGWGGGL